MSTEIFKILRCKCNWQRWDAEPVTDIPHCPKCGQMPKYSANWYTKVTINGKRTIKSIGRQRRQAEQVLSRTQADIVHNKFLKEEDAPLLSQAIEAVWQEKWKRNKDGERAKTRSGVITEILGDLPLNEIDKRAYRALVLALEERELADSSINRYLACLKTILRRHKQDYSFVEMLEESEGRICVITPAEEQQIITALKNKDLRRWPKRQNYLDEFADMVIVLLDTGVRIGELLKLQAKDINFKTNLLTSWVNKADKPRSIPMTDRCKAILQGRADNPKLFACNQNQIGQAWEIVRTALNRTDDDFVPHALRHTCATRLLEAGIDIYTVKEWLGHKTIQTTLRYVHLTPQRLAHAANALQEGINKAAQMQSTINKSSTP